MGFYFDDYKVTYTPTNIVQYNEYYPYGLQTATSWTRENATGNNFLGNGGTELNTTTSLYDLEYRNYDPALARMHQVDPMADKYASYTPYNYSFNAPSNYNDVNGADPSPGEPDFVTRRGVQILHPAEVFNDFTTLNSFFSNGLSSTISSWNPNYGGPVYLGKDNNGNAIAALPSDIQEAGGVQAYVNHVNTVNLGMQAFNVTRTGETGYFGVTNGLISSAFFVQDRAVINPNALTASLKGGWNLASDRGFNPYKYLPSAIGAGKRSTVTGGNTNWIIDSDHKYTGSGTYAYTRPDPRNQKDPNVRLDVYVDPDLLNAAEINIASIIGHEWIHIAQYRTGAYGDWMGDYGNGGAKNIAEINAWGWNNEVYPNVMMPNQVQTPYQMFYNYITSSFTPSGYTYTSGKYWK